MQRTALFLASFALSALFAVSGCRTPAPAEHDPGRAAVIAHRGASAYLPEHTFQAYALACAQGADLIEFDVAMTRDGVLVCVHDLTLERTTDADQRYPDRARADGHWYAADLSAAEVAELRARRRGGTVSDFGVPTLAEAIRLVQGLEDDLGRAVGVMVEPKSPAFHRDAGLAIEEPVLATLAEFGYREREHLAIIECFELASLERMRALGCELGLVWLVEGDPPTPEDLARAVETVDALGPDKAFVLGEGGPAFVTRARAAGLVLFPWTFEGDEAEMQRAFETPGVGGIFANDPDTAIRARARAAGDL